MKLAAWGAIVAATLVSSLASAQTITGNPFADGWTAGGNSMANGVYIRGGGLFSYQTYVQSFAIQAGSNLLATTSGSTWSVGDTVIGIGGVFESGPTAEDNGWGAGSAYDTSQAVAGGGSTSINGNISTSLRLVSKFGSTATSWSPSTIAPGLGNGAGSDSSGDGGVGSVLLATTVGEIASYTNGVARLASVAQIHQGPTSIALDAKYGRIFLQKNSSNIVSSWAAILNSTLLEADLGHLYADLPGVGDRHNIAVQRSTNSRLFNDALIADPVPEPATMTVLGMAALAAWRKRQAKSKA